jgi:hypothetical protein
LSISDGCHHWAALLAALQVNDKLPYMEADPSIDHIREPSRAAGDTLPVLLGVASSAVNHPF